MTGIGSYSSGPETERWTRHYPTAASGLAEPRRMQRKSAGTHSHLTCAQCCPAGQLYQVS